MERPMSSVADDLDPSSQDDQGNGRQASNEAEEVRERGDAPERVRKERVKINRDRDEIPVVRDETGDTVTEMFVTFLEGFSEDHAGPLPSSSHNAPSDPAATPTRFFYREQIQAMEEFKLTTLYVDYGHFLDSSRDLARACAAQYYRFLPFLRRGLQILVKRYAPAYLHTNAHSSANAAAGLSARTFSLAFYNLPLIEGIRDMKTGKIGVLSSISGTVTRTSEVRPELVFGTFTCFECKGIVRNVEQQFKYTEPTVCPNLTCSNRTGWKLQIEQSKFSDWQKVRIQENSNEIPTGSMPRSLDVILRSEIVERAKAGDKCVFTGTFIVVPDVAALGLPGVNAEMLKEGGGGRGAGGSGVALGVSGLKALGVKDLTYKTAFLACMVQSSDARTNATNIRSDADTGAEDSRQEFLGSLTAEELDELKEMVSSPHIYSRLVQSIAPTVYGHEIVKKGILLQLMGGVHKQTPEGMNLRGDLNICVVGDPSTSKSQFLKYVCGFLPRAVYTSGKASSAAGLTAAVVKDEETGEFTIEAGALMLADNGICAIDEFDKMDLSDQVAIHEAMEQQTISIAKAGIQATLNARTSILAAANPVGGRYNKKLSLRANVAMSAPIMSRFDLFFVVIDECNEEVDLAIAQHIVNVHRFQNAAISPEFSTDALQRYIRYARTFTPKLTAESSKVLVEKYRDLRADDSGGYGRSNYRVTVRQLESMVRLSEAIARANCMETITPAFVKEAYLLLSQSIIHVEKDDVTIDSDEEDDDIPPPPPAAENAMEVDESSQPGPSNGSPSKGRERERTGSATPRAETPIVKKPKITITYDKYMTIMQMVVYYLAEIERATQAGLPRSEVVLWYLEQRENEIRDEEELEMEKNLIEKVLTKLVKEKYLLELRGEGLQEDDEAVEADPILMVHPECDVVTSDV